MDTSAKESNAEQVAKARQMLKLKGGKNVAF